MAGRGRGMAGNQGHSAGPGVGMGGPGGAGGGDERRELRRPIVGQPGPNADDLTRGMAKMEPSLGRTACGANHCKQSGGIKACVTKHW